MKLIGARLGHDLHHAALGFAVLWLETTGLDVDFLDEGKVDAATQCSVVAVEGAKAAEGSTMRTAGFVYDIRTWQPWALAVGALVIGGVLWRPIWRQVGRAWDSARAVAREKGLVV